MPEIEILAYSPHDMDKFIAFCVKGKEKSPGVFDTDKDDREIRGVMSWLYGREVPAARFFNTPVDHPMKFFMALVQKHDKEKQEMPWMRNIAGIEEVLRVDGQIGRLTDFVQIGDLLTVVKSNDSLNAEFEAGKKRVTDVLAKLDTDRAKRKEFLAALRSEEGIKPREVFAEIKSRFQVSF